MSSRPDVTLTIIKLIAIELKVDERSVQRAGSLRRDLAMDSVAAANLLFALEEEFDVELNLDVVDSIDSLADLEDMIANAATRDSD